MRSIQFIFTSLMLVLIPLSQAARAQDSSPVKRVSAETSDGLQFSAWVDSVDYERGQDVIVRYRVRNLSPRMIYLVRRDVPRIANDHGTLFIEAPYAGDPKWQRFDFTFAKIPRKGSISGLFRVPASILKESNEWPIRISFGYVTNIYRFDDRGIPHSDWPLNELLKSRIQVLGVGDLSIKLR